MPKLSFDSKSFGRRLDELPAKSPVWQALSEAVKREFYEAETIAQEIAGASTLRLEKTILGSFRLIHFISEGITQTVRTWQHIRRGRAGSYVIWFVLRGKIIVVQSGRNSDALPGELIISSSDLPFRITSMPDDDGFHESYQVVVPGHELAALLPNYDHLCAYSFSIGEGMARIAFDIFASLLKNSQNFSEELQNRLALDGLETLVAELKLAATSLPANVKDIRRSAIIGYLQQHLGEPHLNAGQVANAFNMSRRYLYRLFENEDAGFHRQLWAMRLKKARKLLEENHRLPISEIAFLVGFQSPAHFSRAFRKAYELSPTEARDAVRVTGTAGLSAVP